MIPFFKTQWHLFWYDEGGAAVRLRAALMTLAGTFGMASTGIVGVTQNAKVILALRIAAFVFAVLSVAVSRGQMNPAAEAKPEPPAP